LGYKYEICNDIDWDNSRRLVSSGLCGNYNTCYYPDYDTSSSAKVNYEYIGCYNIGTSIL